LGLYLIQWLLAVVPLVRGSCGYRSIDSGGCRSKGSVAVGPVAPGAVVCGSCGCRSNDSVAVGPVASGAGVRGCVAIVCGSCGCRSNDSVAVGPVAPGAVVRGCVAIVRSTPVTVAPPFLARWRSVQWLQCCQATPVTSFQWLQWLLFDRLVVVPVALVPSIDSGGCRSSCGAVAVGPVAPVLSIDSSNVVPVAPAVAVVRSAPVDVPVAPVLSIDSSGCRSIDSLRLSFQWWLQCCRSSPVAVVQGLLQWLLFDRLRWLSFLWLQVSRFDASVDMDDYQKRSPVENVLESTENSRVIVSNRVHGKLSIC